MLELIDIKKDYQAAGGPVHALRGISVRFRRNEFVSILGASGCGKTTLLNIIGGLDQYTSGDLLIEGVSTKQYKDRDWDTYRNHSIGFIFQSYHLIPHQTILQNVELALTIAGVDKEERRARAEEALKKVGLGDKIKNRPNQLSGGQAQRVAIARALINDPEILLADEPTGALDSKTSVQIMELLKEISRDRLVIMVTHNPELAEKYSTRIIRLVDGEVVDDTMPFDGAEHASAAENSAELSAENSAEPNAQPAVEPKAEPASGEPSAQASAEKTAEDTSAANTEEGETADDGSAVKGKRSKGKKKKTSMSIFMAFGLSLKNLLSKSKRTAMVAVAGSIGIIGVSMVLAISAGVQGYIQSMEDDMLSGYPLSVTQTALDLDSLLDLAETMGTNEGKPKPERVFVDSVLDTLMGLGGASTVNDITEDYVNYVDAMPSEYCNAVQYGYGFNIANNIYTDFKFSADSQPQTLSVTGIRSMYTSVLDKALEGNEKYEGYSYLISTAGTFRELPDNPEFIMSQYDIIADATGKGKDLTQNEINEIMTSKDSLVLVLDDSAVTDINMGQFGYLTEEQFLTYAYKAMDKYGEDVDGKYPQYKDLIKDITQNGLDYGVFTGENAKTFKWYPNDTVFAAPTDPTETFSVPDGVGGTRLVPASMFPYTYRDDAREFAADRSTAEDVDLKVKLILQKKKGISYGALSAGMYYTNALTEHALASSEKSKVVETAKNYTLGAFTIPYNYSFRYEDFSGKATTFISKSMSMMSMMMTSMSQSENPYEVTPAMLGGDRLPTRINIYPVNFDSKGLVTDYLDKWNDACKSDDGTFTYINADGQEVKLTDLSEAQVIKYTDSVGLIINMINTMIEMITVALVAFTALALVVSTVMVGIITYVSVVERIKEIGILRAVGARKKDIKRLFNAETFIIGLAAGVVGIAVTYLLSLILNLIIGTLFGIFTIAALPWWQALVMILVSVTLTLVSGLIPASAAAKKDPVVALRTE